MEEQSRPFGEALHQEIKQATVEQVTLNELQQKIREKHAEFEKLQKMHREMAGTRFYNI